MEKQLIMIGLNELEAKTYLYLLDYAAGRKPAQVADALAITRTNAYKILDNLVQTGLARRSETTKTLSYVAENPIALVDFAAEARTKAKEVEKNVKDALRVLQQRYQKKVRHTDLETGYGKAAIVQAHAKQIREGGEVYFIKSRADIPFMGYPAMSEIRRRPGRSGMMRHGITPASPEARRDIVTDKENNLERKLLDGNEYSSSVEWTVSDDELAIINYSDQGSVIRIHDTDIAESFRQIWKALGRRLDK